jgi:hypothetical protein
MMDFHATELGRVRTRVVERWQADSFDVYVIPADEINEAVMPAHIWRQNGGVWTLEDAGPNSIFGQPQPSFSVPASVMEEIVRQALKSIPSMDRDDAVTDARVTRDRLLTIIEGQLPPRVTR